MMHNKFIRSALSVSNLAVKHLSVTRPKGYQVYKEESSVTRSIRCIKVFQVYQTVLWCIKCVSRSKGYQEISNVY